MKKNIDRTLVVKNILANIRVFAILVACLTVLGVGDMWGATTYKLTQITSSSNVVAGKYVFEDEDGDWVLMPSISSSNLQSTSTYSTTGLSGSEGYIWTVASATGGWYLKNSSGNYFRNSSSTNMSFTTSDQTNIVWTFNFYTDGTISIQNNGTERYIGVNGANIKPYTDTYIYYYKMYLLEEECAKSVTINKGTGTNCTFTLSKSGAQASCDGVSTTVSITPTSGYGTPVVSQSGASAAPSITGSGNSQTVTYAANTTGTSTINVSCSANEYVVLLEDGDGTGGDGGVDVTYASNTNITSVAVPTLTHFDFGGYYTGENGTGIQLIDENGDWLASKTGYTDASKNWIKADDVTLYAKWTEHTLINYRTVCCTKYDITLASSGSKTGGSFEVAPASACEGTDITLMATADDGYEFSAWTVTNDDDDDDDVTTTVLASGDEDEDAVEFDMPAYNITIDATFTCTEPTISAQPSGNSYTQNESADALTVTASAGTGSLDYQWQSSSDNSSWDDIDDETSSTYTPSTTSTGTMYYRVVVTNHECSESVESDAATIVVSAPSVCATPTFSVAAGTYGSAQSVELSCKTDGATIRYTTNGDDPDGSSTAYSSAISVPVNTTIKAKAFKDGMTASSVASATYNIRCAAPTFSLSEDIYVGSQSLTMSSATTGATVRYTTDESSPTGSSTAYSSALTVGATTTYKAKAYKDGMTESEESEVYIMIQCAEPTFNVSAGTYNANQSVSISTTYGTTIYYTLDGNDPTTKSSTYSSALTIDATKTLKAIAVKDGCENSDVASATYTLKCLQPTFSPVAGTYTGAQSVSMSCATTGSAIHYTTNGIDPTGSSTTYSSAISVGTNQTVKAIATKTGWSDSEVASAAYTIKYNVAVASVDNVTISATTPSVAEGSSAAAAYGSTVSLSYSGVASGKTWGGWNVYKTGEASTTVTVTSNQFTMPAYNVTVSAIIYGDAIAWCDPDVEVTGDVHLTSYNGIPVNSTSGADNLIEISSSDFGSATRLDVAYLDADNADAEVDPAESVFLFCSSSDYSTIDGLDLDYEWGTTHSIKYTPNAYNHRDNYKLQFTLKHGDKVLKTVTHAIYGRALPEEFVIASKFLGHWYALPNTMGTATETVTPIQITVDDATTPTKASYAPSTTVYKGAARKTETSNRNSIRLTNDGSHWLITNNSNAQLGLSATQTEGYENREVWYLKSSTFGAYELAMDPAQSLTKKLGMYNGNMGMYADPAYTSEDIYLLPIDTKYTPIDATATDWMKDIIGVTASTSANKLGIAKENGTEYAAVTLASVETSHVADFDGEIDFTGLTGEKVLLKWYDGSTLVGGSQVTVPSIILAGSNDEWSDFASAPTLDDYVVLSKPMEINVVGAKAKRIEIDQSGSNTGSIEIPAGKELIVAETVRKFDGSSFGATGENDLVINSAPYTDDEDDTNDGLGALVMGEHDGTNKATVNFYTLSHGTSGSDASVNQFLGTPFCDESTILYNWYNSWVYGIAYDGSGNIGWTRINSNQGMTPFKGYAVISADPAGHVYWQQGTLNASENKEISLVAYNATAANNENFLANSWMAPIQITAFEASDFVKADATIYMFNSGSPKDAETAGDAAIDATAPAQWITIPISSGAWMSKTPTVQVIPAMQSFSVYTNNAAGDGAPMLKLDYKKLVYNPAVAGTASIVPNRAPRQESTAPAVLKLRVAAESGYSDKVVMLEREDFAAGFENGWDGRKVFGEPVAPQLYAVTPDGKMAVNCVPDYEGTVVGFQAGDNENVYTFTFEYDDAAEALYLYDTQAETYTRVLTGYSYWFATADKAAHERFVLTRNLPQMPTGIETMTGDGSPATGVQKVIINDHIYIIRGNGMYDATGKKVK